MNKIVTKFLTFVSMIAMLAFVTGCSRIEPGWVGIKVNQTGSDQGVENYPLQTGWVFYFPLTTRVYEYPTFQQSVIWCHSKDEGKPIDESISFNCKGGAAISADVSTSGKFKTEKVPFVFTKFRSEPEIIIHTYLRNEVRDAMQRVASKYDPMDILGDKKGAFLDEVRKEVDARVGDWWVTDYIAFANKLRVDERIEKSINAIIEQKQQTAQSEFKVKQIQAEADQAVAKATGLANSVLTNAIAQAQANALLKASLSPEVIQYMAIEKWDGKLPTVTGGSTPFINVNGLTNK